MICPAAVVRHVHVYSVLHGCIPQAYGLNDAVGGGDGGSELLCRAVGFLTSWSGAPGLSALLDFYLAPFSIVETGW